MTTAAPRPALDLTDFRERSHRIAQARSKALSELQRVNEEAQEERIKEGDAEATYRRNRAQALSYYRIKRDMGVTEAQVMADGSVKVVQAKLEHHSAWALRKAAESRAEHIREEIAALERNAANLRAEATMSDGL